MNQQQIQFLKDFEKLSNIIKSHQISKTESDIFESVNFKQAWMKLCDNDISEKIIKSFNE